LSKKRRAQSAGLGAQGKKHYLSVLRKLVILLLNKINFAYIDCLSKASIIFLLSKMYIILAHSKTDLLDIFRKLANSLSENDPDPSAMLFEILIPAALNCSANLKSFLLSALSA
jgi:hypothetical protein